MNAVPILLVDPSNADVIEELGMTIRPSSTSCDLVVLGAGPLSRATHETLSLPLAFAAGAVLAALADTLMPEAYEHGGPTVALSTAAGFLLSFVLSLL